MSNRIKLILSLFIFILSIQNLYAFHPALGYGNAATEMLNGNKDNNNELTDKFKQDNNNLTDEYKQELEKVRKVQEIIMLSVLVFLIAMVLILAIQGVRVGRMIIKKSLKEHKNNYSEDKDE